MSAPQGTAEWLQERCGKITMSPIACLIAEPKGRKAWTDKAVTWARRLAVERVTGQPIESGSSASTEWGHQQEDAGRAAYEFAKGVTTRECGFICKGDYAGGSPDGFSLPEAKFYAGIHEIKCPHNPVNHVATMQDGVPKEHLAQCMGNLWVTGAPWCDYVSYQPLLPERSRLYVQRLEPDPELISKIEARVQEFNVYVESIVETLR